MEEIVLTAAQREVTGKKVKRLRRQGVVPVVLYGRRTSSTPLTISRRALEEAISKAGGTQLIKLQIDESASPRNVLLRDIQRDPLSQVVIHADLYEVVMTEKIRTEIPINLVGKAPAVELGLGILISGLDSVEVECLPSDLIPAIAVDISNLKEIHQNITVSDLQLGEAFTVLSDPDEMIVSVAPLGREEVEVVTEEVAEPTLVKPKEKAAEEE